MVGWQNEKVKLAEWLDENNFGQVSRMAKWQDGRMKK